MHQISTAYPPREVHSVSPADSICNEPSQSPHLDEVVRAIDSARAGWLTDRNPKTLRRALAKLIGELE